MRARAHGVLFDPRPGTDVIKVMVSQPDNRSFVVVGWLFCQTSGQTRCVCACARACGRRT